MAKEKGRQEKHYARGHNPNSMANLKRGKRFAVNDDSARKAGEKSMRVQTERRALADIVSGFLYGEVTDVGVRDRLAAAGIAECDFINLLPAVLGVYEKSKQGDQNALLALLKIAGLYSEKTEATHKVTVVQMTDEEIMAEIERLDGIGD